MNSRSATGPSNATVAEISERITHGELEPVITNRDLVQAMIPREEPPGSAAPEATDAPTATGQS